MSDIASNLEKFRLMDIGKEFVGSDVNGYSPEIPPRKDNLNKQKKAVLTSIETEPYIEDILDDKTSFTLTILEPNTILYGLVDKLFKDNRAFDKNFVVQKIARLHNSRVLEIYEVKRDQNLWNEEILFHGTPIDNLDGILENNFDKTKTKRGRHGWGINFNMYPCHSVRYCRNAGTKVLIVVRVLIKKYHIGIKNMTSPYRGFDATTNFNGKILVKYEDHTFYPEFVVFFEEKEALIK